MRRRLSPSLIVAVLALAVALGGTAGAASYIITSTKQIKPSVRSALKGNRGPRGYVGDPGLQGAQGPQGPAGPSDLGQAQIVLGPKVSFTDPSGVQSATAFCPAGQRAISGGGASISSEQIAVTAPTSDRSGWFIIGIDYSGSGSAYVQAEAVCAPTGKAVAASVTRAEIKAQIARRAAQVRAMR